jgi:hypothetical protein
MTIERFVDMKAKDITRSKSGCVKHFPNVGLPMMLNHEAVIGSICNPPLVNRHREIPHLCGLALGSYL